MYKVRIFIHQSKVKYSLSKYAWSYIKVKCRFSKHAWSYIKLNYSFWKYVWSYIKVKYSFHMWHAYNQLSTTRCSMHKKGAASKIVYWNALIAPLLYWPLHSGRLSSLVPHAGLLFPELCVHLHPWRLAICQQADSLIGANSKASRWERGQRRWLRRAVQNPVCACVSKRVSLCRFFPWNHRAKQTKSCAERSCDEDMRIRSPRNRLAFSSLYASHA